MDIPMKKYIGLAFIFTALVATPASAKPKYEIDQELGQNIVVGVGESLLRIEKRVKIKNVLGRNDIFGRRTIAGVVSVRFLGHDKGELVFKYTDTSVDSGATTMNQTPQYKSNSSTSTITGQDTYGGFSATVRTEGTPEIYMPNAPAPTITGASETIIRIPYTEPIKRIIAGKYDVMIIAYDKVSVTYEINPNR